MSDNLGSDISLLTDDSSDSNRTIDLEEATFPSRTPVIDISDLNRREVPSNFDEDRGTPFVQSTNLRRLSLGSASRQTPIRNSNLGERKPTVIMATPRKTIVRPSVAKLDFESKATDSAFQRRKAYDEARRKSLIPSASKRIDPRRKSNSIALLAAKRRQEVGSARNAKRAEDRRMLINRNRPGLNE
nr:hypothetical transcript [Hymenolepis microstoma]